MSQPTTIAAKLALQARGPLPPRSPFVPDLPGSIRHPLTPLSQRFVRPPVTPMKMRGVPQPNPTFARWEAPPEPGLQPGGYEKIFIRPPAPRL